jgi:RND family efflux transporter MFP subunit
MTSLLLLTLLAQSLETTRVEAKPVDRTVVITGEILPFQTADIVARVPGYIESVEVDRGSVVRKGQTLARLSAPELLAQVAEAEAKVATVRAQAGEARARVAAAQSTAERLRAASGTPGAVAANELIQADEAVKAAQASLETIELNRAAQEAHVKALRELESFLLVQAPFDGVVTERRMHPGGLAGPTSGAIVRLEQVNRLRVVAAVPEANVPGVRVGQSVSFTVAGYPGETFRGNVARISRVVDMATRTMPVELDFVNSGGKLAPGMYTQVEWPAVRGQMRLLVPPTAIAANTERSFVVKVEGGVAKYVDVRRGVVQGDLVEVRGALAAGDVILLRGTDEVREGTKIGQK